MKRHFTVLFLFIFAMIGGTKAQTYCTSYATSTLDSKIDRVVFNTINSVSGPNTTCQTYTDYTSTHNTTLTPGGSYTLTVYYGTCANHYTRTGVAYADWNNDGDFDDTNESLGSFLASGSSGPQSITVNVPTTGVAFGSATRLRVIVAENGARPACGTYPYGETEDYSITVLAPEPMYYDSSYVIMNDTNEVFISQNHIPMMQAFIVNSGGSSDPVWLDEVWFSASESSNASDIKRAWLFTENDMPFSLSDTIASVEVDANGKFMFDFDSTILNYGANSLWVAYDLNVNAGVNNVIDCAIDSFKVTDTVRVPNTATTVGNAVIVHPKDYTGYCGKTRTSNLTAYLGISRVIFEGIDNSTGMPNAPGNCLTFHPDYIPVVFKQKGYPLRIKHGSANTRAGAIYIDWNNNSYFESTERYATWNNLQPASFPTYNINIPCEASPGYHRFRIVNDFDGVTPNPPTACGTQTYGEAEDYLFYIPPDSSPVVSFATADPNTYVGGLNTFIPSTNVEGNFEYVWDWDNDMAWDDTTTGNAKYIFNSTGAKTVRMQAILYGCNDTLYSNVATLAITLVAPTTAPNVNFISNLNTVTPSIPVRFTDLTTQGPYRWKWVITPVRGDNGNPAYTFYPSDTVQEPTVQFHEVGDYTVKLIAENIIGTDSAIKVDYITVNRAQLMCADLNTESRSGYLYDDGGKNGNYTDPTSGEFKVCNFLIQPKCATAITLDFLEFDLDFVPAWTTCTNTHEDAIRIFDGVDNTGTPLHLNYLNPITGQPIYPNGFANVGGASAIPPSTTAVSGAMYIEFYANCAGVGAGFEAKWSTQIFNPSPPTAGATGDNSVYTMQHATFYSQSSGYELDYFWDFDGDGYNEAYDSIVSYQYTQPGSYNVRLVVQSCDYFDTTYHTITVVDPTAKPSVDFNADYVRVTVNDDVTLMDNSGATVYAWRWEITPMDYKLLEGTTLMDEDVKVRFNKTGLYTVKLVATNAVGSDSLVKTDYITCYETCEPAVATLTSDIGISTFVLEVEGIGDTLLYNTSEIGQADYTDYSLNQVATIYKTGDYTFTLERLTNYNNVTWTIYMDMNQDGQFADTEKLGEIKNYAGTSWSPTIQIPTTALTGLSRIRLAANAGILNNKGCGPNYTGEFEDYGVIVKEDNEPPVIVLDTPLTITISSCGTFDEPGYMAYDMQSGDLTNDVVVTGLSSINFNQPGTHTISYDVDDNNNNSAVTQTRTLIILSDIIAPEITITNPGYDSIPVFGTFTDPGFTAFDGCAGIKTNNTTGTVNTNVVGVYTLTYESIDNQNNVATAYRYVTVYDDVDPQISLIGNDSMYVEANIPYTEPGVSITDNYYNGLEAVVTGTVDTTALGTYFLTYCVTDSSRNGPICVDRKVVVGDMTPPTVSFDQTNYIVDVKTAFQYPVPELSDNYWAPEDIILKRTGTVNTYKLGIYTISYVATDASGNVSTQVDVTVEVVDRVAPTISLLGKSSINILRWREFNDPWVEVEDNYYDEDSITIKVGGTFENTQVPGLYSITYQACDPSGNCSEEISRLVYVLENTGINEEISESNFKVYPNPVVSNLTIEVELPVESTTSIQIYNSVGKVVKEVYQGEIKSDVLNVNVEDLASGSYFIRFTTNNEQFNKKFIITK